MTRAWASCCTAWARARSASTRARAALNGAGSIWNNTSPALTSAPSSKRLCRTMPATRARTSATRIGSTRPGRVEARASCSLASVTVSTGNAVSVAACCSSAAPQPASATATASQLTIPIARKLLINSPEPLTRIGANGTYTFDLSQFSLI
ncbi:hypothetical protein EMIT047CA2_70060 [Pseudomonas soli]